MSTPELESDHYDVIVLGTGLAESIAAASLAKAGKTVLHLDPNEYYGGEQASLTLDELCDWAQSYAHATSSSAPSPSSSSSSPLNAEPSSSDSRPYPGAAVTYSSASTTPLTPQLENDRRRYAISLFPSILPSRGKLIDTLIASDVSKYVSFRLLDSVSIYDQASAGVTRVPGSKEEVFKDKSIGLLDKRRLMKFLLLASGEFEDDPLLKGKESEPLIEFLKGTFSLPNNLAESITYAIAHCSSPDDETLPSLIRARRYLRSLGRYGTGAFLVGQYGGAGEVAQGFCRACAVFGGTYVLGSSAKPASIDTTPEGVSVQLPCHPRTVTASHLISSPNHLPPSLLSENASSSSVPTVESGGVTAHGIAIVSSVPEALRQGRTPPPQQPNDTKTEAADANAGAETQSGDGAQAEDQAADAIDEVENDDTGIIVFPPHEGAPLVRGYINGPGTGSCPSDQYIIYLSAALNGTMPSTNPSETLGSYWSKLGVKPAFEAYYLSHRPVSSSAVTSDTPATSTSGPVVVLHPYTGGNLLTEGLDHEAGQGEEAYYAVIGRGEEGKPFFEKETSEEEEEELGM